MDLGFLGKNQFLIRFDDVAEIAIAHLIAIKIPYNSSESQINIEISLLDLFKKYQTIQELESELLGKYVSVSNRTTELLADFISFYAGESEPVEPNVETKDAIEYFNEHFETKTRLLLNGDSSDLKQCITSYSVDKSNPIHKYLITLNPTLFLEVHSKNMIDYIELGDSLFKVFNSKFNSEIPYVSWKKQLEFVRDSIEKRLDLTGEILFDYTLQEGKYRHILASVNSEEGRFTFSAPYSLSASGRVLLIFLLEINGLIDVVNFRISSDPLRIENIVLMYAIRKPSIINRFMVQSKGLSVIKRRALSETQIVIYERIYDNFKSEFCFGSRPLIENSFCDALYWIVKKITYCLEEPSFLKTKALDWLQSHKVVEKYVQMEDEFFLPFLHEKLVDEFGATKISKKPELFGGEVDILFDTIPIELKVRKSGDSTLMESIVEEKYKPASQAAVYASTTRVAFVWVLDMPSGGGKITNIENCFKVIKKSFSDTDFKTCILVCSFYCDSPKPSSAT